MNVGKEYGIKDVGFQHLENVDEERVTGVLMGERIVRVHVDGRYIGVMWDAHKRDVDVGQGESWCDANNTIWFDKVVK